MVKYTVEVNGESISQNIERDSYHTQLTPVFTRKITTLDLIGHCKLARKKVSVSFSFNPQKADVAAHIAQLLLNAPCTVVYHCMQRNADVIATMVPDAPSADYLSRCLCGGADWVQPGDVTLEEL